MEGFLDVGNADNRRETYIQFVASVLAFIVSLVILAFVGQYLWNHAVVDIISFAKPARSIWQILGLMIFIALLRA